MQRTHTILPASIWFFLSTSNSPTSGWDDFLLMIGFILLMSMNDDKAHCTALHTLLVYKSMSCAQYITFADKVLSPQLIAWPCLIIITKYAKCADFKFTLGSQSTVSEPNSIYYYLYDFYLHLYLEKSNSIIQ